MHRFLKEMLKKIIQNCPEPEIGIKFHSGSFITPAFALKNRLHMLIEHSSKGIAVGFCGVSSISGFNCEQKNGESDIQDAMMQIMQSPRKQRSRSLHRSRWNLQWKSKNHGISITNPCNQSIIWFSRVPDFFWKKKLEQPCSSSSIRLFSYTGHSTGSDIPISSCSKFRTLSSRNLDIIHSNVTGPTIAYHEIQDFSEKSHSPKCLGLFLERSFQKHTNFLEQKMAIWNVWHKNGTKRKGKNHPIAVPAPPKKPILSGFPSVCVPILIIFPTRLCDPSMSETRHPLARQLRPASNQIPDSPSP